MRFEELCTVSVINETKSYRASRVLEVSEVVVLSMNLCDKSLVVLFAKTVPFGPSHLFVHDGYTTVVGVVAEP